mmetsp:Transcript_32957/g.102174  ORF Transcript_32957/g.102174 Transcript_32957/m.102174 type:complete len:250 (+) Transcript_32957:581-1330(+)
MTSVMCSRISVSKQCVAATVSEHGSAGRTPAPVTKIRDSNILQSSFRSCLPICVSHSDVTTKRRSDDACSRLETANDPKVPPECDTISTSASFRSQQSSANAWPVWGIGKSWPHRPSSLFAETHRTANRGKHAARSAANCSPSHNETSHPVTTKSTAAGASLPSARRASRARSCLAKLCAVNRFRPWPVRQSSLKRAQTPGRSLRSRATSSAQEAGSGPISGFRSNRTRRRRSGPARSDSWKRVKVALP